MSDTDRIESLEEQVRSLKRMLLAAFGVLIVAGLLAAKTPQTVPDVIQAKKFELVNDEGRVRARLFLTGGQEGLSAMLQMHEKGGMPVVQVSTNSQGGQLEFFNGKGKNSVSLNTRSSGGSLQVRNEAGQRAARLKAGSHGGGELEIRNKDSQGVVGIGADHSGDGLLRLGNSKGDITASLP